MTRSCPLTGYSATLSCFASAHKLVLMPRHACTMLSGHEHLDGRKRADPTDCRSASSEGPAALRQCASAQTLATPSHPATLGGRTRCALSLQDRHADRRRDHRPRACAADGARAAASLPASAATRTRARRDRLQRRVLRRRRGLGAEPQARDAGAVRAEYQGVLSDAQRDHRAAAYASGACGARGPRARHDAGTETLYGRCDERARIRRRPAHAGARQRRDSGASRAGAACADAARQRAVSVLALCQAARRPQARPRTGRDSSLRSPDDAACQRTDARRSHRRSHQSAASSARSDARDARHAGLGHHRRSPRMC